MEARNLLQRLGPLDLARRQPQLPYPAPRRSKREFRSTAMSVAVRLRSHTFSDVGRQHTDTVRNWFDEELEAAMVAVRRTEVGEQAFRPARGHHAAQDGEHLRIFDAGVTLLHASPDGRRDGAVAVSRSGRIDVEVGPVEGDNLDALEKVLDGSLNGLVASRHGWTRSKVSAHPRLAVSPQLPDLYDSSLTSL